MNAIGDGARTSRPQSASVPLDDRSPAETASDCGPEVRAPGQVLKTGEDGPTHADPQPLQLLQENFPLGSSPRIHGPSLNAFFESMGASDHTTM
ncbi:MAG TPA: hypothetical protein VII75_06540 [Thermoanaerobaculia bacterium]|nr:hypothetical protein [Thermoanaerobaculia bacterium]